MKLGNREHERGFGTQKTGQPLLEFEMEIEIAVQEAAARAAGYSSLPAPPTFPMALDMDGPENMPILDVLDIDIARILHGSQEFEYFAPICAGDRIAITSRITDMFDKKGGALEFVVSENTYTNQSGQRVAKATSTLVVRNG